MMLGVTIGDLHTGKDLGLNWVDVSISAPEAKTKYIDVPGRSAPLDLSEAATGYPTYDARDIVLTFDGHTRLFDDWERKYSELLNAFHGRRLKAILDTDPGFYYEGRVAVGSKKDALETDTFTISIHADPFKRELTSGADPWLWDPFNFETGIVREYSARVVDGTLEITVPGRSERVVPKITCSTAMSVSCQGKSYALSAGENKVTDLCLGPGENVLTFTGSGTVSIDYRGGEL